MIVEKYRSSTKNNYHDTLSIFDFDKTLIKADSFRLFSLLASDNVWKKIVVFCLALFHKSKAISNSFYKVSVLRTVWFTKKKFEKEVFLDDFYKTLRKFENERVCNALKKHLKIGDKVVVISASPLFYLEPYFKKFGDNIEVVGSTFRLTGRKIAFVNLYGDKKAFCIKKIIQKIGPKVIWVYTDHISDLPIIKLADRVRLVNPSGKLIKKVSKYKIDYEIY
jgi:phosphoserine phosphatase